MRSGKRREDACALPKLGENKTTSDTDFAQSALEYDASSHRLALRKQKRRSDRDRRFRTCGSCQGQELYDDLYLTEQPYGLVCGVLTDFPANDSSRAAFT
jgi:hypothetical protein